MSTRIDLPEISPTAYVRIHFGYGEFKNRQLMEVKLAARLMELLARDSICLTVIASLEK